MKSATASSSDDRQTFTLVDLIIQGTVKTKPWLHDAILYCAVTTWFDEAIIQGMRTSGFDDILDQAILDELKKLPFCQEHPIRGWTYHEDIRAYLLSREEVRNQWQELNSRAANTFKHLLDNKQLEDSARFENDEWRNLAVEWLYHQLNLEPSSAIKSLRRICLEALLEGQKDFCAELLGGLEQRVVREKPNPEISQLKEGVDALLVFNNVKALPMLKDMVSLPELTSDQKSTLLYRIGKIHLQDEDLLAPALEELEKARQLTPDQADIYAAISEVYHNTVAEAYYLSGPTWGNYERAWKNAEIARDKAADSAVGYVALGQIYTQQEEWEKAIKQYEKAIEVEPDVTDSYLALSNIYSQQFGNMEGAIAMIDKVTEVDPTASSYYVSLNKGYVYSAVRRYQQAIEQYEQAKAEAPEQIDAYLALGNLYTTQGKLSKAEEEYKKVIELNPDIADGYRDLADLYISQEKLETAITCCHQALSRKISKEKFLYFRLDSVYQQQGRFKELEEIQNRLVQLDSMEEYSRHCILGGFYLAEAWKLRTNLNQAKFLENTGNARSQFEQGIEKEPKRAWAYLLLGELAVLLGDEEKLQELETLVSDKTPWAKYDFFVAIGQAYLNKFEGSEAEAFLQKATELSPHRTKAWLALSDLYRWQGNPASVAKVWAKLIRINPSLSYQANLATGYAYEQIANYKKAGRKYTKAQHLEPDTADAYRSLALLDETKGKWDEAIANYFALEKFANLLASDYVRIAVIQIEQAKYQEAETAARTAILINPEQSDGYIVLGRIGAIQNNEELIQEARTQLNSAIHDKPYYIHKLYDFDYLLAEIYNSMEAYPKAQSIYHLCIEQAPERADAYIGLGTLLLSQKEYNTARDNLLKAKRIDSTNIEVYIALSQLSYEQRDVQGVKDAQQQLTALMPAQRYNEHTYLAAAYEKAYKTDKQPDLLEQAKRQYQAAIKLSPWRSEAYVGLGLLLTEQDMHEEAEKVFQLGKEAAEINYLYLGQYYEEQGKLQEALKVYQLGITYESAEFKPDLYFATAFLLHQKLDRLADAEKNYRKAIELASNQPTAYLWLMRLLVDQQRVNEAIRVCNWMAQQPELKYNAYISLGRILSGQGRYIEAEQVYQQAIDADSQQIDSYLELALLYQQESRLEEAEQLIRQVLELEPNNPNALVLLGSFLLSQEKFDEAESVLQKAIQNDPVNAEAYFYLGQIYEQQNNLDLAEEINSKAIELAPKYGAAYVALGRIYGKQGKIQSLEQMAQRILELDPKERYEAHLLVALAYQEAGYNKQAEETYQDAIAEEPELSGAYVELMYLLINQNRIEEAKQVCHQIESLPLETAEQYQIKLAIAQTYVDAHLDKLAIEQLRQAVELDQNLPNAHIQLAGIFVSLKEWAKARNEYEIVGQLAPELKPDAYLNIGYLFVQEDKLKEAKNVYQQAIETDPNRADVHLALGRVYVDLKLWKKAEKAFHQAISLAPENLNITPSANLYLADIYRKLGRKEEMREACANVVSLVSSMKSPDSTALRQRGLAHFRLGEYEEVAQSLNQALEANPQDAQARFYLALNLLCLGQSEAAQEQLQQGIYLAPDKSYYKYAIEEAEVLAAQTPEIPGAKEMLQALIEARDKAASSQV